MLVPFVFVFAFSSASSEGCFNGSGGGSGTLVRLAVFAAGVLRSYQWVGLKLLFAKSQVVSVGIIKSRVFFGNCIFVWKASCPFWVIINIVVWQVSLFERLLLIWFLLSLLQGFFSLWIHLSASFSNFCMPISSLVVLKIWLDDGICVFSNAVIFTSQFPDMLFSLPFRVTPTWLKLDHHLRLLCILFFSQVTLASHCYIQIFFSISASLITHLLHLVPSSFLCCFLLKAFASKCCLSFFRFRFYYF